MHEDTGTFMFRNAKHVAFGCIRSSNIASLMQMLCLLVVLFLMIKNLVSYVNKLEKARICNGYQFMILLGH